MRTPPRILVADADPDTVLFLQDCLPSDYEILTAADGEQALAVALQERPDLVVLEALLPKLDGIKVCQELRARMDAQSLPFIPVILLSARVADSDIQNGLEMGADEYLKKPVAPGLLCAKVAAMLRLKSMHDELGACVKEQRAELELANRLKGFLSHQVVDLIVSPGGGELLKAHRREVTVVFTDLRGFTDFVDRAERETVSHMLKEYHRELGSLIDEYGGTLERFTGDGLMVFFNDPGECPKRQETAVKMAVRMRERVGRLVQDWEKLRDQQLGFGVGIDDDWATIGQIGFEGRYDYSVIGKVVIRSARLCAAAGDGQILVTQPVYASVADLFEAKCIGDLELKGFPRPIRAYNILQPK